jgi:hypothetical protein
VTKKLEVLFEDVLELLCYMDVETIMHQWCIKNHWKEMMIHNKQLYIFLHLFLQLEKVVYPIYNLN